MSLSKRKQTGASYPWSQRKISVSNPFPRYGHSASQSAISNEFFLFGGISRGKSRNEAFVVEVNTLNVLAFVTSGEIPSSRSGHTHVNIGKNVIVYGGLIDETASNADENLYILDTVSKVWSRISVQGKIPLSRHGHSVSVVGTKMYVFGGQHIGRHLNDLIAFDTKTRSSWEFIVPNSQSPPCRSGHVSFAYNEKIYIFGGIDENRCYNDLWCYDIRTNVWTELSCTGFIPHKRYDHGSSIVDDVIYVFGGRTFDGHELGDLTAFRITNQRWYMFQKMGPAPTSRYRHTMTTAQNKILVFGGESSNSPKPDEEGIIHILDTSKIKYPSLSQSATPPSPQAQVSPKESFSRSPTSPISMSPQSSFDSDIIPRHITPTARQSSMPRDESISDEVRVMQQAHRSLSSTKRPPENMDGVYPSVQQLQQQTPSKASPQPYNQGIPNQQMYSRNPSYSQHRQTTGGTRGYDVNAIVMSNSKGNPPEQITYIERERSASPVQQRAMSPQLRSVSPQLQRSMTPQQRSIPYSANFNEDPRKQTQTPPPFGSNIISNIVKPLVPSQRSNESLKSSKKQSIFENPRQAPRPPNSTSPVSINTNVSNVSSSYEGGGYYSPPVAVGSPSEIRPPASDIVNHSQTRVNAERDERDEIIASFKRREIWFRAELALARKSGYTLDNNVNDSPPDGIDVDNLVDMGDPASEKPKVLETIIRLKQEIKRSKASIANQAQIASQKITDSERARTAALQEAAYLKAKLTAITNASESELASIEVERANDLEKRLTQALIDKEDAQQKFIQAQQSLSYEKSARESAEERANDSITRAEEAEGAHAHVLVELASLHSRATSAESSLRESKTKLAETTSDLSQYRSENEIIQSQLIQLQQTIDQRTRALDQVNKALAAADERTNEMENLWKQSKQEIVSLEKESAGLRAELDIKMRDLERSKDTERLLEKAQKDNEAMKVMMQEGMNDLLNNSKPNSSNSDTNDTLDASDKLKLVKQELSALKIINNEAQKTVDETAINLSEAKVKILQLESSVMKGRSDSAVLQRRLAESNDEIIRTKGRLREKERILEETSRALEDAEVKVGMMRDVMTERGILEENGNFTGVSMYSKYQEMEARCEELESMHVKTQSELKSSIVKYKDALLKAREAENKSKVLEEELERTSNGSKSLSPDITSTQALEDELRISETKFNEVQQKLENTKQKLSKVESDYSTATRYVKDSEKMLRRMKDELTKNKADNSKLRQQLSNIQQQNEKLEDRISELENQDSLQKGFRASRQDFANVKQLVTQREEFLKEKEGMKKEMIELSRQAEHAREEKLMSDQSYDALRKEYDNLRKEFKVLRQNFEEIQEKLGKIDKDNRELQDELEETLSLNDLLNQQLDEVLKNNGTLNININSNAKRASAINRELKWKQQREQLEKQVEEFKLTNQQLREENSELDNKLRDSENRITLLLDQMETAVDSYRGLEEEIKETSPRNSRIISSITNELDILKSQFEISNNDVSRWSKVTTDTNLGYTRASSRLEEDYEVQ